MNQVVTWEFLEACNEELSAKLGVPPRTITLREESVTIRRYRAIPEYIAFDPKIVAHVDEDEARFMVALALVHRRHFGTTFPIWNPLSMRLHAVVPYLSVLFTIALFLGLALFKHPDPFLRGLISISILAFVASTFLTRLRMKRLIRSGHFRHDFSSLLRPRFYEAVALTGNSAAGERYLRKAVCLRDYSRGQKILGDEPAVLACRAYEMNVPPEFQPPQAFDSIKSLRKTS